jgi:hypothetical protein
MTKISLVILTLLFSNISLAEWTIIAENKEASAATFVDLKTARKMGNSVEMWSAVVFLQPQNIDCGKIMSFTELDEFDCKLKRFRIVSMVSYTGKLASGAIVSADYEIADWMKVPTKSISEMQWNLACN